jgi:hypothetical protein
MIMSELTLENNLDEQRMQAMADTRFRITQAAKRMIHVTFQKEGVHKFPGAVNPEFATGDEYDVSFLAHPHRHIFHFRVGIEVFHNDREIEFIQFKRWIENLYGNGTLELDNKSCEMISDSLYEAIASRYPERDIHISVSEDNENGSTIFYNTSRPIQLLKI